MKHLQTFEGFLNEDTIGMENVLAAIKEFDKNIKFNKRGRTIEFPEMDMDQLDALCRHLYDTTPTDFIEQQTTGNHLSIIVKQGY